MTASLVIDTWAGQPWRKRYSRHPGCSLRTACLASLKRSSPRPENPERFHSNRPMRMHSAFPPLHAATHTLTRSDFTTQYLQAGTFRCALSISRAHERAGALPSPAYETASLSHWSFLPSLAAAKEARSNGDMHEHMTCHGTSPRVATADAICELIDVGSRLLDCLISRSIGGEEKGGRYGALQFLLLIWGRMQLTMSHILASLYMQYCLRYTPLFAELFYPNYENLNLFHLPSAGPMVVSYLQY